MVKSSVEFGKQTIFGGGTVVPDPSDTEAPTVPKALASSNVTDKSATLTWTASTDNKAVAGYKVYRNGTEVGSVSGTTFTDSGLTAKTAYTYTVKAYDAAGNFSAASSALTVTTLDAATPPATPAWDAAKTYNKGDRVSYKGKTYEAQWWTQGNEPGAEQWGPWLLIN